MMEPLNRSLSCYSLSAPWFTYCSGMGDFFHELFFFSRKVAVIKINPIRDPLSLRWILMPAVPQDLSQLLWKQTVGRPARGNAFTEADCWCSTAMLMFALVRVKHDFIFPDKVLSIRESERERFRQILKDWPLPAVHKIVFFFLK